MTGLARFWLTSLGLCAADLAGMTYDAARWLRWRATTRPPD